MKINQILLYILLCAFALIVTNCSSDNVIPDGDKTDNDKVIVSSTADINNIEDKGISQLWKTNDKIAVKVDDNAAENLLLSSGAESKKGTFTGSITSVQGTIMVAYFPMSASIVTNLTSQDGKVNSAAKTSVMFARTTYSTTPVFTFSNKTSILKFNMDVPAHFNTSGTLTATVSGAYSKGILDSEGLWTATETADIAVDAVTESENKINGYVVVIPGSNLNALRITVSDGLSYYKTAVYTNTSTKIEQNQVIEINQILTKVSLVNFKPTYADTDYFQWDAVGNVKKTDGTQSYNIIFTGLATNSCSNCPTKNEIAMYLAADCFWDPGNVGDVTTGKKICTIAGKEVSSGLWLKKKKFIIGFAEGTAKKVNDYQHVNPILINSENCNIRTCGQYFFLPASGSCTSVVNYQGISGGYWCSTPLGSDPESAYGLYFDRDKAYLIRYSKVVGHLPCVAE